MKKCLSQLLCSSGIVCLADGDHAHLPRTRVGILLLPFLPSCTFSIANLPLTVCFFVCLFASLFHLFREETNSIALSSSFYSTSSALLLRHLQVFALQVSFTLLSSSCYAPCSLNLCCLFACIYRKGSCRKGQFSVFFLFLFSPLSQAVLLVIAPVSLSC